MRPPRCGLIGSRYQTDECMAITFIRMMEHTWMEESHTISCGKSDGLNSSSCCQPNATGPRRTSRPTICPTAGQGAGGNTRSEVEFQNCFSNGDPPVSKRRLESWGHQKKTIHQDGFLGRQNIRYVGTGLGTCCTCTIGSSSKRGNSRTKSQNVQHTCPVGAAVDGSTMVDREGEGWCVAAERHRR
jgi:hypothetical protein